MKIKMPVLFLFAAAAQLLSNATAPVRVQSYVEDVVDLYSDIEFKSHFRMQRSSFEVFSLLVK